MCNILFNGIYFDLMSGGLKDFVNWFDKNPRFGGGFLCNDFFIQHITQVLRKLWPD
jgi:hypothetical protein